MGPYAGDLGVDYNLSLCQLQSRHQHVYHLQLYAEVELIPQSGTLDLASGCKLSTCTLAVNPAKT